MARAGLLVAGAVLLGLLVYLKPASAQQIAVDALDDGNGVTVDVSRSSIRLTPTDDPRSAGLAFYPGALVDPQAYAHVLRPIAEAGFPVVIFKQPYNLAVLDSNAANAVIGDPDDTVDRWAVGGHSLGGAMASNPIIALFQLHIAGFGAVNGHIGFDKLEITEDTAAR